MKRSRVLVPFAVVCFAATLTAKDVYLPIVGSVGVFRTDARVVNPSGTKDISITATFFPAQGQAGSQTTVTVTVPKRQQKVYDDVVASLFTQTGLGAIKLSSPDDFVATARIYATAAAGTLGQFEQGVDATSAKNKGLIPQLKSTGSSGQTGTFRTNIGFVNTAGSVASVTLRLYDKNNAVVNTQSVSIPANGVLGPTNYFAAASGDFTDAWASYESDQPLIAYGSVVDNGSTDPTFIQGVEDTGGAVSQPVTRTYEVVARTWRFDITPGGAITANVGDTVVLRLRSGDVPHGFQMPGFVDTALTLGSSTVERTFVVTSAGTFEYFCTVSTCGAGHDTMTGTMVVTNR